MRVLEKVSVDLFWFEVMVVFATGVGCVHEEGLKILLGDCSAFVKVHFGEGD